MTAHKEQAAAELAAADELEHKGMSDEAWRFRFEALIHAILYLGDALAHNRITIDQR